MSDEQVRWARIEGALEYRHDTGEVFASFEVDDQTHPEDRRFSVSTKYDRESWNAMTPLERKAVLVRALASALSPMDCPDV